MTLAAYDGLEGSDIPYDQGTIVATRSKRLGILGDFNLNCLNYDINLQA